MLEADRAQMTIYIGYLESKDRLHISLAHPRDCHLRMYRDFLYQLRSHRREIRGMFMFVPVL